MPSPGRRKHGPTDAYLRSTKRRHPSDDADLDALTDLALAARAGDREALGRLCQAVQQSRAENPCRCDRLVGATIGTGIMDPQDPRWARHRGVVLPIETTTIDAAARELDLAEAVAEVYRSDPSFAAPPTVWRRVAEGMPTLLGSP